MRPSAYWESKNLAEVKRLHVPPYFGGKGNGLVRLAELDLAIPETAFFDLATIDHWVEQMVPKYRTVLDLCARWEAPRVLKELRSLHQSIAENSLAQTLPIDFSRLRELLGDGEWIVRSSMSIEDSESSSFSGCFDSIRIQSSADVRALSQACLKVLLSAFDEKAMIRILAAGGNPREFRSGFLIQKFVAPRLGGVCFTRDPSRLWISKQGLVEWGTHGECVVQGTLNPGQMGLARRGDDIPCGLEFLWERLWEYSDLIEDKIGAPAEWEWVWDGSLLWAVQARPIATQEARLVARTRKNGKWSRGLSLERFPKPLTPMGWTALEDVFLVNLKSLERRFGVVAKRPEDVAVSLNGVVYSDPDFFRFPKGVKIRWSHYLAPYQRRSWTLLFRLGTMVLRSFSKKHRALNQAISKLEIIDALMGDQAQDIEENWVAHRDRSLNRMDRFQKSIQSNRSLNPLELLSKMETLRNLSMEFLEPDLAIFLIKDTLYNALLKVWIALGRDPNQLPQLIRIPARNSTLEMNLEWNSFLDAMRLETHDTIHQFLNKLDQAQNREDAVTAGGVLGLKSRQAWQIFFSRNSHLRTTWDVAIPSWGENVRQLVPLLKVSLQSPPSVLSNGLEKGHIASASSEMRRELEGLGFESRVPLVEKCLKRVEDFMQIDEEQHCLAGILLDPSRDLILSSASILQKEGLLEQADDVFFVELRELKNLLRVSAESRVSQRFIAERRKSEWKRSCGSSFPHELPPVPSNQKSLPTDAKSDKETRGLPVSPGEAVGMVHRVEDMADIQDIPPGAILVTTSPNPTLTPVYPLISGMISVTGGPLSHGFVAAREYGLPAVSCIENAVELFRPGMKVRIDGNLGRVEVLEK